MTARLWEVRARTHEGGDFVLRRFATEEEANAHPVKLSLWNEVWVQQAPGSAKLTLPLIQSAWTVHEAPLSKFTYIHCGEHRIMSLHGPLEQRDQIVALLRAKGLVAP